MELNQHERFSSHRLNEPGNVELCTVYNYCSQKDGNEVHMTMGYLLNTPLFMPKRKITDLDGPTCPQNINAVACVIPLFQSQSLRLHRAQRCCTLFP